MLIIILYAVFITMITYSQRVTENINGIIQILKTAMNIENIGLSKISTNLRFTVNIDSTYKFRMFVCMFVSNKRQND